MLVVHLFIYSFIRLEARQLFANLMVTVYRTPLTKRTEASSVLKVDSNYSRLKLPEFKDSFSWIQGDDIAAEYEMDGDLFFVFYCADRAVNVCHKICQYLNEEGDRCFNATVGSSVVHKQGTYKFVPGSLGDSEHLQPISSYIMGRPSRAKHVARSNRKKAEKLQEELSQKKREGEAELAYQNDILLSQIESKKTEIQEMELSRSNQINLMTEFLVNGDYTEVCKRSFGLTKSPRANTIFFAANVKKIYEAQSHLDMIKKDEKNVVAVKHPSAVKKEARMTTFETGEDKSIDILQQMLQASPVSIASRSTVASKPQPQPRVYSIEDQKKQSYYTPPKKTDMSTSDYYSANSNDTPRVKPLPEYKFAPRGTSCAYCKFGIPNLYSSNYKAVKEGYNVSSLRSHYTQDCPINMIKELFAPKPTCTSCAPNVLTTKPKNASKLTIRFDEDGYAMVPRNATRKCEEKSNGSGSSSNGGMWSLLYSEELK